MNVLRVVALFVVLLGAPVTQQVRAQSTIDTVQPTIVKIFGAGGLRNLNAYSTGILVEERGYVMTVWNHVLDTSELTVVLSDGRRYSAEVVDAEPALDVAVLRLQSADETFPAIRLADAADVTVGTRVLAFSNMFKVATGDEPVSVVHGVVAARTRLSTRRGVFEMSLDTPLYILDAITNNAGAEGGLLTTLAGQPIGMIGRQLRNAETNTWVNYAVPLTELRDVVERMIAGNYTARAEAESVAATRPEFDPADFGLVLVPDVVRRTPGYVDAVLPGSPAAVAGIRRDDLVVFVDDELVQSVGDVRRALGRSQPKQKIRLVVRRGDALKTVELTVPSGKRKRTP